jgi:CBS domain-containing protein
MKRPIYRCGKRIAICRAATLPSTDNDRRGGVWEKESRAMMQIPVSEIMTRDVITVPTTMPVKDVAQILAERKITGLPVVDDAGNVVGVLSELDIISRQGVTAGEIMSAQVISATEETDAEEVAHLFTSRRIRRVPILADGKLVGIVSRSDLMRLFMMTRWVCENCGFFVRGFDRPDICPSCGSDRIVLQREPQGM